MLAPISLAPPVSVATLVWPAPVAYHGPVPVLARATLLGVTLLRGALLPALLLGCSPTPSAPTTPEGGAPSAGISSKPTAPPAPESTPTGNANGNPSATANPGASPGVAEVVAQHPVEGAFTVTGYAAKVLTCPPCPPGALCKPCMGDNVVLSDDKTPITSYQNLGPREMIIFGESADITRMHVGERYRVSVEVRGTHRTSEPYNDLWLKRAEPAP
jgi:hypothetical protein